MAYASALVGRVFILRWTSAPDVRDMKALEDEIIQSRRIAGQPLINFSLIPDGVGPPDNTTRVEMKKINELWRDNCDAIHVVVGGEGFKTAMLRAVIVAVALAIERRGLVSVHKKIDDAVREVDLLPNVDTVALVRQLEAMGIAAEVPLKARAIRR